VRHLREYFAEAGDRVPAWVRWGLKVLPGGGPAGRALAWLTRWSARRLARKFIAGSNIPEAVDAVAALRKRKLAFTVDLLGEATITEPEADRAQAEYLELVRGLSGAVNAWPTDEQTDR